MKKLLLLLLLVLLSGCSVILLEGKVPPKFKNGQIVQIIETKWTVTIIGTACDVRKEQQMFERCRYLVKLPLRGERYLMFEEAELEPLE